MAVEMKTKPRIILSNQPSLYTAQRKPIGMLSTSTITNEAAANCSVAGRAAGQFSGYCAGGIDITDTEISLKTAQDPIKIPHQKRFVQAQRSSISAIASSVIMGVC